MKYDLYDFDGTIYDGDSGVDLVKFAIKKNPKFLLKFPKIAWYSLKFFLNIGTKEEAKNVIFSFLKDVKDIDAFVKEFWENMKSYYTEGKDAIRLAINKSARTVGGMKKLNMPSDADIEGEYDGVTKEDFKYHKKEANKYVKISNEAGDRLIARIQELENEQLDYDGGSSDNDDNRPKRRGKSEDWDEVLTSYEEYVDKYVSLVKKAAKGDAVALASYPSLMKKAEDLADKLDDAEDDMSSAQLARYKKITKKLMKAAEELDD